MPQVSWAHYFADSVENYFFDDVGILVIINYVQKIFTLNLFNM